MNPQHPIDPGHNATRSLLRGAGPLIFMVGGLFALVGGVNFFSAFGGAGPPTLFWCLFVGLPLMGIGTFLTKAGYAGKIIRYYSQEITPAATDTFNYAARETKDGIREIAGAIGEGLRGTGDIRGSAGSTPAARCHRCNHDNAAEARFCSRCGAAMNQRLACPGCGDLNAPDARFCDNCGRPTG